MLIEVVTFGLRDGVSEAQLLEADAALQRDIAPFCEGFVRRTTARSSDGGWAVVTFWYDRATADRANEQIAAHPAGARFAELIDGASVERRCFTSLD